MVFPAESGQASNSRLECLELCEDRLPRLIAKRAPPVMSYSQTRSCTDDLFRVRRIRICNVGGNCSNEQTMFTDCVDERRQLLRNILRVYVPRIRADREVHSFIAH